MKHVCKYCGKRVRNPKENMEKHVDVAHNGRWREVSKRLRLDPKPSRYTGLYSSMFPFGAER